MRVFTIVGRCRPDQHYMIPPERRLPGCAALVDKRAYFVVHAPRQTGKTTTMKALARRLTERGRYAGLHFSCEEAAAFPDNVRAAERAVWGALESAARADLPELLRPPSRADADEGRLLSTSSRAGRSPAPISSAASKRCGKPRRRACSGADRHKCET